jgi:hypothetical protein
LSLSLHAGYGHSTPHTIGGKLFTMAYALVGIPLGLVMFQSIGERLNNFSSFVIRNVKRVLKYENVEASETNLIIVVTVLLYSVSFLYTTKCIYNIVIKSSPFSFVILLTYFKTEIWETLLSWNHISCRVPIG